MSDQPQSATAVDDHLDALDEPHRSTLRTLRVTLRSLLPHADECIKYGMPAFAVRGKGVAGYEAYKNHCSYFPMSGSVLAKVPDLPAGWLAAKGTLHFPIDKPPAKSLIRKLVKLRLDEISNVASGPRLEFFADGAIKAEGKMRNGELHGDWRWYRRDGSLMRTGRFRDGVQIGTWDTYNADGQVVRTTRF